MSTLVGCDSGFVGGKAVKLPFYFLKQHELLFLRLEEGFDLLYSTLLK